MPGSTHPRTRRFLLPEQLPRVWQYAFAVAVTGCALLLAISFPHPTFVFFIVAMALAAWVGGLGAGLLSAGLSLFAALYLQNARGSLRAMDAGQAAHMLASLGVGVLGVPVVARLRAELSRNRSLLAKEAAARQAAEAVNQKLVESESRFRKLFEAVPVAVTMIDPLDLSFLAFNDAAASGLGYTRAEFEHLTVADIEAVMSREEILGRIKSLGDERRNFETKHRAKNGEIRDIRVVRQPVDFAGRRLLYAVWEDITELKRAESRLRRFYDAELFAIFYWHIEGGVIDANDKFLEMTGYTREDLKAGRMNWAHMTPPEYQALDEDARRQVRETGVHEPYEKDFLRKDGTRVSGVIAAAAWEDNRREGVSFIIDTTGRKRAEQALRTATENAERQSTQLQAVLNSMNEGVVVADAGGKVLYWNPFALQLQGYKSMEEACMQLENYAVNFETYDLNGKLLPLEDWPISRVLRGEQVQGQTLRVHRTDLGIWLVIKYNGAPVRDANGAVTQAILTLHDVTAETRAQEAVRRSEERFRRLFESNMIGVVTAEVSGRILDANDAYLNLVGFTRDEIKAGVANWRAVTTPDSLPRDAAALVQVRERGYAEPFEKSYLRRDGRKVSVIAGVMSMDPANPHGDLLLAYVVDITQRKLAEDALVRSEKLATAGRLAATIAHEINNPLAAAMNAVYVAGMDTSLSPSITQLLNTVDEELKRAAQITRQTLGFYRESGERKPVELGEIAESVLALYRKRINSVGLKLVCKYRPAPPALAIPGEVRQVLANLVANAIDASSRGGTLHLRTAVVSGQVALTVADTGTGISAENLRSVFEPFFTTKDVVGTGLGLWVTQQIVRKHGGGVRVRSRLGKGTVFRIYLPAAEESESSQTAGAKA